MIGHYYEVRMEIVAPLRRGPSMLAPVTVQEKDVVFVLNMVPADEGHDSLVEVAPVDGMGKPFEDLTLRMPTEEFRRIARLHPHDPLLNAGMQ